MATNTVHRKNTDFFYDDLRVFLVEDELFRIPIRELMTESAFFADMFRDATPSCDPENGEEGSSEQNPIVISDESAEGFALMLKWMYKSKSSHTFTTTQWIECLRIGHKFRLVSLMKDAQNALSDPQHNLDPVEKVNLCFRYELSFKWARDALNILCNRWESVPQDSGIPPAMYLAILQAREQNLKERDHQLGGPAWCSSCSNWARRRLATGTPECRKARCPSTLMIDKKLRSDLADKILAQFSEDELTKNSETDATPQDWAASDSDSIDSLFS
ncbi:hypothetical protein DL96DRAFT_1620286 [Flagelloscypha sp. PMI_526]|nr:hypothetical protein DL96DRAFT_1620286 [Flagelloscypha sp. PMI_526]